jgi:excisionase family DNA binding protein
MPAEKTRLQSRRRGGRESSSKDTTPRSVLTLSEVAEYLRLPQGTIMELVNQQGLPGRQIGSEWRFLRSAVDDWLRTPLSKSSKEALLTIAGNWKDDPHLDGILAAIYEQRGRPSQETE